LCVHWVGLNTSRVEFEARVDFPYQKRCKDRRHMRNQLTRRVWMAVAMLVLMAGAFGCAGRMTASDEAGAAPAAEPYYEAEQAVEAPASEGEMYAINAMPAADLARKVIANARIDLVVADAQETVREIEVLMTELGGFVSNANLYKGYYGGAELLQGSLTLRVPAESLENALARLEEMALDTNSRSIDRQDVTDEYTDIEAQLRNLEATENELRELLAEVRARPNATAEDILAVHRNLSEVRGQIEQLQGRKNMMDNLISLSTIEVTLTPDAANRPVVEDEWRPVVALRDASRTLVSALQFLGDALIWIVVFVLPILLLFLIPLALLIWLIRALVRRRRRNRAKAA